MTAGLKGVRVALLLGAVTFSQLSYAQTADVAASRANAPAIARYLGPVTAPISGFQFCMDYLIKCLG